MVHFADLDDDEVEAHRDGRAAGGRGRAFTIDGLGGPYVTAIEGDPSTVVGVSLPLLRELVRELGLAWHDLRTPTLTATVRGIRREGRRGACR